MVETEKTYFAQMPPQALDLEEAVLGALLLDKDAYLEIASIVDVPTFYKKENQLVFAAIKSLATQNQPIDMLIVTEELRRLGTLEEVGGPFYLVSLTSRVASAAHIEKHARILAQKHMARQLIQVAADIQKTAYDDEIDVEDLLIQADKAISGIYEGAAIGDTGTNHDAVIAEAFDEISEDCTNAAKGILPGIPTGFDSLDAIVGGWKPGILVILAARPGVGKTSLALQFAKTAAQRGKWVNFFSFEMRATDLAKIFISGESGVSRTKIRDGKVNTDDWQKISQVEGTLPIKWIDRTGINVHQIKTIVRKTERLANVTWL